MNRPIKFRAWDNLNKKMIDYLATEGNVLHFNFAVNLGEDKRFQVMQFTGLKDKNGLQEVYEGDIIDEYGNIKGNTYEMDAGETDFIIQGFGDKNWGATYKEAVGRGCTDTQRYADKDEVRELE